MEWVNRFRGQGNSRTRNNGGAQPPAYSTIVKRSIRPALLISTLLSAIYLVFVGASNLKSLGDDAKSAGLKLFDILIGAFCLAAAAIEILGFTAALRRTLSWAKLYARLSMVALALTLAAEVAAIVEHYTRKSEIIADCVKTNTGSTISAGGWFGGGSYSSGNPESAGEAQEDCDSQWSRNSAILIIWLVILVLLGLLFVHFAFTFARDLTNETDPSYRRANNLPTAGYSSAFTYDDEASPFDHDRYDASGDHAYYEMDPRNNQNGYAYPPPSGPPPPLRSNSVATSADAPEYEPPAPGRKSMASIDLDGDRKDPNGPGGSGRGGGYSNGYGYEQYATDNALGYEYPNRPESSRSVRRETVGHDDDDDQQQQQQQSRPRRRSSDDTLREAGGEQRSATPKI